MRSCLVCFSFFLSLPRPPISTLFPYTTLFRSLGNFFTLRDLTAKGFSGREIRYLLLTAHYRETLDRKSTRLNSSHRCISYAVFCLKKKTMMSQLLYFPMAEIG